MYAGRAATVRERLGSRKQNACPTSAGQKNGRVSFQHTLPLFQKTACQTTKDGGEPTIPFAWEGAMIVEGKLTRTLRGAARLPAFLSDTSRPRSSSGPNSENTAETMRSLPYGVRATFVLTQHLACLEADGNPRELHVSGRISGTASYCHSRAASGRHVPRRVSPESCCESRRILIRHQRYSAFFHSSLFIVSELMMCFRTSTHRNMSCILAAIEVQVSYCSRVDLPRWSYRGRRPRGQRSGLS